MRILLLIFFLVSSPFILQAQKLRIAVAANAQYVAKKLQQSFKEKTGIEAELVVSSSGKLTTQIQQGAPFDIFLSADVKYPLALYNEGLTTKKPDVYARGVLVLWTLKPALLAHGLQSLSNPKLHRVAIGNPKTAPYGTAALQAIEQLKLLSALKPKLVFGESLSQVNQYLNTGAAEFAFTAKSVVLDPALLNKGKWIEINSKFYSPLEQGVVILKRAKGKQLQQALAFYQFLFSPQGRAIFKAYGYK